jgi:lycopene beta-cyclase
MEKFDRVVIGAGLSGLMLADHWLDPGVLKPEERVLILDPEPESICSRTFASWKPATSLPHRYSGLVEQRWDRFRITESGQEKGFSKNSLSFGSHVYERIPGESFYRRVHPRHDSDPRFELRRSRVAGVEESKDCASVRLESGETIEARNVWSAAQEGEPGILQHFLGYEIETEERFFDPRTVDLMDFRVPQQGQVRFIYILPFSETRDYVKKVLSNAAYYAALLGNETVSLSARLGASIGPRDPALASADRDLP